MRADTLQLIPENKPC